MKYTLRLFGNLGHFKKLITGTVIFNILTVIFTLVHLRAYTCAKPHFRRIGKSVRAS